MENKSQEMVADVGFLRNMGLALVFLTLLTGSVSLIGALTFLPADNARANSYGIDASLTSPAE